VIVLQIFVLTFVTFTNLWVSLIQPFWTWFFDLIDYVLGNTFMIILWTIAIIFLWPFLLWEFLWPADEYCDRNPNVDSCRPAELPAVPLGGELIGLFNA